MSETPSRFPQIILTASLEMKQVHLAEARFLSPSNGTRKGARRQLGGLFYQFAGLVWLVK